MEDPKSASDPRAPKYPVGLLAEPIANRFEYFRTVRILHFLLKVARDDAMRKLRYAPPGTLLFVFGPPSVGKSTMLLLMLTIVLQEAMAKLEKDPAYWPVVATEVPLNTDLKFGWINFFEATLKAFKEPLIDHKLLLPDSTSKYLAQLKMVPEREWRNARRLADAVANCFCYRQSFAQFLDEAHHLQYIASGRDLLGQMEAVKSYASLNKIILVLFGTYDLLELTAKNAQLGRRALKVHFRHYRLDTDEDVEAWKDAILALTVHLPLARMPDLERHYKYLYERTAGCFGALKNWFERGLGEALENNQKTLTRKNLENTALSAQIVNQMFASIEKGEKEAVDGKEDEAKLDKHMDLATGGCSAEEEAGEAKESAKSQLRPFERSLKRDPVGQGSETAAANGQALPTSATTTLNG